MGAKQSQFFRECSQLCDGFREEDCKAMFDTFTEGSKEKRKLPREQGLQFLQQYAKTRNMDMSKPSIDMLFEKLDPQNSKKLDWDEVTAQQQKLFEELKNPQVQDCFVDDSCPKCKTKNILDDPDAGCRWCMDCGEMLEAIVDDRAEWRSFADDDGKGAAQDRIGKNDDLSGDVGNTRMGAGDNDTASRIQHKLKPQQKKLQDCRRDLRELAGRLNLPHNIVERAERVLQRAIESRELITKRVKGLCEACIYVACKKENNARTIKDIVGVSGKADKKSILQYVTKMKKAKLLKKGSRPSNHKQLLKQQYSRVGFEKEFRLQQACEIIEDMRLILGFLDGRKPQTVVATIITFVMLYCKFHEAGQNRVFQPEEPSRRDAMAHFVADKLDGYGVTPETILIALSDIGKDRDKLLMKLEEARVIGHVGGGNQLAVQSSGGYSFPPVNTTGGYSFPPANTTAI